ncbi:MAG TPA: hypothetical protein VKA74_09800 [Myxococcota bacterium]|nr:hypothetical protein [Myxococcota bacterium]
MTPETELDLRRLQEAILVVEYWRQRGLARPSETYRPHRLGQLQFHESEHTIRCLFPGNGFGKTRCIAEEVHAWCSHSCRWQNTPEWPIQAVWLARNRKQFALLRDQLEVETFGDEAEYTSGEAGGVYTWEDGSKLHLGVAARSGDWKKWEGINPDLVVFDELPRQDVWREMMMRRRVRKKTRFCVAATATSSGVWAEAEIYRPWLDHHLEQGLELWREDAHPTRKRDGGYVFPLVPGQDAHSVNNHPTMWVWTRGGIYSNPAADEDDFRWYEDRKWTSDKEREVRLWGGFANWLGDSVFDEAGLMYLLEQAKKLRLQTPGVKQGRFVGYRRAS